MKIGALTAAWSAQPLEEVLDYFAKSGLQAVEVGTGNYPGNAHCDPVALNADAKKREAFVEAIKSRGLELSTLSCHGNPLHPDTKTQKAHHKAWRDTLDLAASIGVKCVTGFSGLPAGGPKDKVPNWVVAPWPEDHLKALEYQWEVATEYWTAEAAELKSRDLYVCFEMHPNFLVYNPETLLKLRRAVGDNGDRICANFDPSHLIHQFVDPAEFIAAFPDRIYHVHVKDSKVHLTGRNSILSSHLDFGDPRRGWDFVSPGHGDVKMDPIVRWLNRIGYKGPLSIEWEDSGMDREHGAREACEVTRKADFTPSSVAFDAAFAEN